MPEVGSVEAGSEDDAVPETQLLDDVLLHQRCRSCGQSYKRHAGIPVKLIKITRSWATLCHISSGISVAVLKMTEISIEALIWRSEGPSIQGQG